MKNIHKQNKNEERTPRTLCIMLAEFFLKELIMKKIMKYPQIESQ